MYLQSDGTDLTTDVVVIGTGPGGLAAVASAQESGAEVVAIEAWEDIGGNGTWSTGWVAFVDSKLQRRQGIKDSVEIFMNDCEKLINDAKRHYGIQWDKMLTRLYAEESSQMYDILTSRGVKFPRLIKRPLQTTVPRLAAVENTEQFKQAFESDFAGPNVKTFLNTTAVRLLTRDGSVIGVRAAPKASDASFSVFARKGVILATGGYQANSALRQHYQAKPALDGLYPGLVTCRGDGHLLGQAIGGDLINMSMIPPIVQIASALTDEAIAVNIHGKRFHDEAGPYQDRVDALKKEPEQKAHYIFDATTAASKRRYVDQLYGGIIQAESIEELAEAIHIDAKALVDSVKEWNDFIASGAAKDPVTGRVDFTDRGIVDAPFYASPMLQGISLTCGGFVTTASLQVVNIFGLPISGLFAVGDVAGGFVVTAEMGGTHLGGGFVHGWRAGRAAATGQLAESHHTKPTFGQALPQTTSLAVRTPIINADVQQAAPGPQAKL